MDTVTSELHAATPALELLRRELTGAACTTPNGRLVVSVPPQEGLKTSLVRELCVSLLTHRPERRILYVSYSESLANMQGRAIAEQVDANRQDDWRIKHSGSLHCCGPNSGLGGRVVDVMVVDDPLRSYRQAQDSRVRADLHDAWDESLMLKLTPGASVVAVQSRTHSDDLAGRLITQGWPSLNIPALADGVAPDALQRPIGTWLESLRGRTEREWKDLRLEIDEPTFTTMWQGCPY